MKKTKLSGVVGAMMVAVLALAGCSDDKTEAKPDQFEPIPGVTAYGDAKAFTLEGSTKDLASINNLTVAGEAVGEAPSGVEGEFPLAVAKESIRIVSSGDGEKIADGDGVVFHTKTFAWETGDAENDSFGKPGEVLTLSEAKANPLLRAALVGQNLPVRMIYAAPATERYPAALYVLDVTEKFSSIAAVDGKVVEDLSSLPFEVTKNAADASPEVKLPADFPAVKELKSHTLIEGNGPAIEEGSTAVFQYVGFRTRDGSKLDSSWDRGEPFSTPIGYGAVIKGWDDGLPGVKVGSRVALVIPQDQAYQEKEGDLIFIVDVLGTTVSK